MNDPSEWRLSTPWNNIPFRVVSRQGVFSPEEASATERYIIPANRLLDFVLEGFPLPLQFGNSLIYPQPHTLPGLGTMRPMRIKWKAQVDGKPVDPFGSDPDAPDGTYGENVIVDVEFATSPENDEEQDPNDPFTFLEASINASGVFLAAPIGNTAKWVDPDSGDKVNIQQMNIPYAVPEYMVEWSVKWPRIPFSFWSDEIMDRLRDKLGHVNDDSMSFFHDAPANTVLFLGFSANQSFTWRPGKSGQPPMNLSMSFQEKNFKDKDGVQVTHQHFYKPGIGWRELLIDDENVYPSADLGGIWEA